MKENNYEYLANQAKYLGFPESVREQLKKHMEEDMEAFFLEFETVMRDDLVTAGLFFRRPVGYETYFFNHYRLQVRTESNPEGFSQTFYISGRKKGEEKEYYKQNFTFTEGYNLLAGLDRKDHQRFVYGKWKNMKGEIYGGWKGLDPEERDKNGNYHVTTFHDHYGFSLENALSDLPIREKTKYLSDLIRSLKKGNLQAVTSFDNESLYLAAYPPGRRINVFDLQNRPVRFLSGQGSQEQTRCSDKNGDEQTGAFVKDK